MQSRRTTLLVPSVGLLGLLIAASVATQARAQAKPPTLDLSPTAAAAMLIEEASLPHASSPTFRTSGDRAPDPTLEVEFPGLEHRADGSYRFRGKGFTAIIAPDGQVRMRDTFFGFSKQMKPLAAPGKDLLAEPQGARFAVTPPWLSLQFDIDLLGYLESKLGNDLHTSEKRWFMEGTRAMRERLEANTARQALRHALHRIWSDFGLTFSARKKETFEVWNQTTHDEQGAQTRHVVEEFVREKCPAQSACAYDQKELDRLNAKRRPQALFAPYVASAQAPEPLNVGPAASEQEP